MRIASSPHWRRWEASGLFFSSLLVSGCAAATVPIPPGEQPLLALDAAHVDYPVMLSKVPTSDPGRPVGGSGESSESHTYRDAEPGIDASSARSQSPTPPFAELDVGFGSHKSDRWLQIEHVEYRSVYGLSSGYRSGTISRDKQLTLKGSIHR